MSEESSRARRRARADEPRGGVLLRGELGEVFYDWGVGAFFALRAGGKGGGEGRVWSKQGRFVLFFGGGSPELAASR